MGQTLPHCPDQASTVAGRVDGHYFYRLAVSVFFATLIALSVIVFAIPYRRRSEGELPRGIEGSLKLELAWTVIPLFISLSFFFWGAKIFFAMNRVPDDAIEINVIGKQWMWKVQHADGQREINELHVPVGRPVRLTMTSEDVIHDFFVPAFRMKQDSGPGQYTRTWFEASKPGRYHIFCSQYCGTKHSSMIGWVHAMEPGDFQAWLAGGAASESLASAGAKLFQRHACNTCHRPDSLARGPNLEGLFGKQVQLADGRTVVADESYLRESILTPNNKIVAGFQPIMPTFQGLVSEEELLQLVAYVKSLSKPAAAAPPQSSRVLPPSNRAAPPTPSQKENPK